MAIRSKRNIGAASSAAGEVDVDETALAVPLCGDEIFVTARRKRRDHLPVALRRGRHGAKGAGRTRTRAVPRGGTAPTMHVVDVDGEAETVRIALRRSFEDASTDDGFEMQESAAG